MKTLRNQHGAALIFLLVVITLMGLMAGVAGSTWTSIMKRERERELLWRGGQIRDAIGSYYQKARKGAPSVYPANLKQLLKDPRYTGTVRHLRELYLDPVTGEDWEIIKAPGGGIKGVRSSSQEEPMKTAGFRKENEKFEGKSRYADWQFVFEPTDTQKAKTNTPQPGKMPQNMPTTNPFSQQPAGQPAQSNP